MATGPGGPRNLLIGLIFLHLGSCEHEKIFGLMKSNVTLSPLKKADFKDITWKKDKDKVAEWQENSQPKYFGSFNGRAILDKNGNFTILNLMTSDESLYELESLNPPGNELKFLYVFRVPKPHLSCSFDDGNITISCNESGNNDFLSYQWKFRGTYLNHSVSKMQLRWNPEDLHQNITCITINPVSSNESTLLLKSCVPETDHGRYRYPLLLGAIGVVIIVAVIFLKYVKKKRSLSISN
ncbi:lymphocyte function-associated antigen 3 isoform X2 [Macrotis lagotis]|uniref:lymphocyte function-associated antigen 3 isoform X2 n=1 Tax=Macrotis lagotis TaxID=92651 RepID=UPI003D68BE5E